MLNPRAQAQMDQVAASIRDMGPACQLSRMELQTLVALAELGIASLVDMCAPEHLSESVHSGHEKLIERTCRDIVIEAMPGGPVPPALISDELKLQQLAISGVSIINARFPQLSARCCIQAEAQGGNADA